MPSRKDKGNGKGKNNKGDKKEDKSTRNNSSEHTPLVSYSDRKNRLMQAAIMSATLAGVF